MEGRFFSDEELRSPTKLRARAVEILPIIDEFLAEADAIDLIEKATDPNLTAIHRIADRLSPKLKAIFLGAARKAKADTSLESLARAIGTKNAGSVLRELPLDQLSRDLGATEEQIRVAFKGAGNFAAKELARSGVKGTFDLLNEKAVGYARDSSARLVREIGTGQRDAIRALVENAFVEGIPPKALAVQIRDVVGLTDKQMAQVDRFRGRLEEEGAPPEEIEHRTGKYADAVLRQRAENIARTESLDSSNAGQQATWDEAEEKGFIEPETEREWIVTDDDRLDEEVCFHANTKILTADGWKAISKIKPGDLAMTHRDRFRPVRAVRWKHYDGKVVRMKFGGRARLQATATYGHRILTTRGWVSAEQLKADDEIRVSAVPCLCGKLVPFGLGRASRCKDCAKSARIQENNKRWARQGEKEKLAKRNRERWALSENRQKASEFLRLNNPVRRPEVREKIRKAALRRPKRPRKMRPRRRTAAEWAQSPLHPFRRPDLKKKASDKLVRWRASLDAAQRREIEWRAAHNGLVAAGKNAKGSSFLERKMKSFLENQGIQFEPQWKFFYEMSGKERFGFADFYVPGVRLVIECDGYFHDDPEVRERDRQKTRGLIDRGLNVLRFTEAQIRGDFASVASAIRAHCCLMNLRPSRLEHYLVRHQVVYDIEVEEDHSFVAGGVVAHNCEPMDGQRVGLHEPFTTGDGRKIMRPTAHPRCRCSMRLVIKR